jgi:pimeloyl-ACP methyl ester carboxylesterase
MTATGLRWEHRVVDGRPIRYGILGEGHPLLFLHGWGLGYRSYSGALRHLAESGARIIAPALPGFAGSPGLPGPDVSFAGYAAWLREFLDAVGLAEPVALVGHSFGGGVAIQFAHDHPNRVRSLVLVNSVGGSAWARHGSVLRSMTERPLWDWGLHLPLDLLPVRQLTRVLPVILGDAVPNVVRDPGSLWRVGALARRANLTAELEDLRERGLPIVVLWGKADRVLPRASMESLCAAAGMDPDECVTVPGKHTWLLADPRSFGEVMTNIAGLVPLRPGVDNGGRTAA